MGRTQFAGSWIFKNLLILHAAFALTLAVALVDLHHLNVFFSFSGINWSCIFIMQFQFVNCCFFECTMFHHLANAWKFLMSEYQSTNLLFYSTENMHCVLEIERRCIRYGRRPSSLIINALWYWNPTSSGERVVDDDDDVSTHTLILFIYLFIYLLTYFAWNDTTSSKTHIHIVIPIMRNEKRPLYDMRKLFMNSITNSMNNCCCNIEMKFVLYVFIIQMRYECSSDLYFTGQRQQASSQLW